MTTPESFNIFFRPFPFLLKMINFEINYPGLLEATTSHQDVTTRYNNYKSFYAKLD